MPSRPVPLAFIVMALAAGCADRLVLYPPAHADPFHGSTERKLPFRDGVLQIWTLRSPSGKPPAAFVLEFGGNATRAEWVVGPAAERWRAANPEVWSPNFPGFGGSTGPAKLAAVAPSALAAYDALREVAGDRPIYVVGRSLGTTAALHVAAHRPVAGVVLHSATPLATVVRENFGWWNLWIASSIVACQIPADLDAVMNAKHCTAPALFIVTEKDWLVHPAQQRTIVDAYAGPKQVYSLPRADHGDNLSQAQEADVQAVIAGWTRNP